MLAGACVDLLTGLLHLGHCAFSNEACTAVKRMLLGEYMNKKLASFPGATPKYTSNSAPPTHRLLTKQPVHRHSLSLNPLQGAPTPPNISWKEDICSATKYMQVINSRLLDIKHFISCVLLKVGERCPIVNMGGMGSSKFPPTIRQASQMAHGLNFVH